MSGLKGQKELNRRLRAIKQTFKIAGKDWAEETVKLMQRDVPVKSGKLRKSFRVRNASQKRATVAARYTAFFIDAGTKAHTEKARKAPRMVFTGRAGNTVFARRVEHPATRARRFRERDAKEALRRKPMAAALIRLWNRAA
jgi:hypothetical protein